ncbi:Excinuclease ABC C subunit domain protein (modular protein) [uncultured Desulfobacterium sp.]|uniref:Excinuclease ABC C subunit domain protein (Modular protein) n=1 Tax=uncultured Desulfobacterium sp. TaxID=201089 RepID=A0A445MX51_9BACT|nr:Excinuclease ABC C subunit domain protein (modular protein) [uncultured Desulfobacterium sp.]
MESREKGARLNKQPAVYILASRRNGTLYIGVTSDLVKRIWEHKNDLAEGFTKKYGVHQLVWYELHEDIAGAIQREKSLKEWKRAWKLNLIEKGNPNWEDLYYTIVCLDSDSRNAVRDRLRRNDDFKVFNVPFRDG